MFKQIAWGFVKGFVRSWLANRALILPAAKRVVIAGKLGISTDQVAEVNAMIITQALDEFDRFKP